MGMMTRRNVKSRPSVVEFTKPVEKPIEKPVEKPVEKAVDTDEITREEVNKMPYFGLKALALKHDIEVEGKKAAKLKEEVIKKLNL